MGLVRFCPNGGKPRSCDFYVCLKSRDCNVPSDWSTRNASSVARLRRRWNIKQVWYWPSADDRSASVGRLYWVGRLMHTHAPIGAVAVGRVPESADFATDFATERRPTSADAAIIGVWVRPLRDWSLITGRGGGATKREGGHVKFYPYEKGGAKSFGPAIYRTLT